MEQFARYVTKLFFTKRKLLHEFSSRFLISSNGTKSRKASQMKKLPNSVSIFT